MRATDLIQAHPHLSADLVARLVLVNLPSRWEDYTSYVEGLNTAQLSWLADALREMRGTAPNIPDDGRDGTEVSQLFSLSAP